MQQNGAPGRLFLVKRALILSATMLLSLLQAGAASASDLVYSVYSPYLEHNVRGGIYTSQPNGSERVRLTRGQNDFGAQWSPDRTSIAFVRTRYDQQVPNTLSTSETTLFSMRADGTDKTVVWQGSGTLAGFDWAPDSNGLVYSHDGDLYVIDERGQGEYRLTETPQPETEPDWSPDGDLIAFTGRSVSGAPMAPVTNDDIYAVSPDGGQPRQLTTDTGDDFEPVWSPDSTRIAFISSRGHCCDSESYGSDVYLVGSDGADERRVTDDCTWKTSQQWLPHGSALIYESHPDDDGCLNTHLDSPLNLVDLETGSERDLLSKRWNLNGVALSSSGRWVAFSAVRTEAEGMELFRVRVRDELVLRITDNKRKASDVDPDW
jgi:Tol biopolymer transport system component